VVALGAVHVGTFGVAGHQDGLVGVDRVESATVVHQILETVLEAVGEIARVYGDEALAEVGLAAARLPRANVVAVVRAGQDAAQDLDHECEAVALVAAGDLVAAQRQQTTTVHHIARVRCTLKIIVNFIDFNEAFLGFIMPVFFFN
jgi:hypothetical protein